MSRLSALLRRQRSSHAAPSAGGEGNIDHVVWDAFFATYSTPGVMVEVGAAGPEFLSIGALYRSKGWRVLSIEPNPVFAAAHRRAGNEIVEVACSDHNADEEDFFVVDRSSRGGPISFESFSSLGIKGVYAEQLKGTSLPKPIKVRVRTLDRIAAEAGIASIDLLAADVEGWELQVMRGLTAAPRVVILENLADDQSYRDYMWERGYRLWRSIPPNEVYLRNDQK